MGGAGGAFRFLPRAGSGACSLATALVGPWLVPLLLLLLQLLLLLVVAAVVGAEADAGSVCWCWCWWGCCLRGRAGVGPGPWLVMLPNGMCDAATAAADATNAEEEEVEEEADDEVGSIVQSCVGRPRGLVPPLVLVPPRVVVVAAAAGRVSSSLLEYSEISSTSLSGRDGGGCCSLSRTGPRCPQPCSPPPQPPTLPGSKPAVMRPELPVLLVLPAMSLWWFLLLLCVVVVVPRRRAVTSADPERPRFVPAWSMLLALALALLM